jgi:hypothetical protein
MVNGAGAEDGCPCNARHAEKRISAFAPWRNPACCSVRTLLFAFDKLPKQFAHLALCREQSFSSERSGAVDLPQRFPVSLLPGSQVSFLFETMQQGVESSRADTVSMPAELFHHAQTKDGFFHRVMEHVQANQTRVQVAVSGEVI